MEGEALRIQGRGDVERPGQGPPNMEADHVPAPPSPSRLIRFMVRAGACLLVLAVAYLVTPRWLGGASTEERQRIEADWASVVEAGAVAVTTAGPPWEGSRLERAVEVAEVEGADGLFLAVGDGTTCPLPEGSAGAVGMVGALSPERIAKRSLDELAGLLTLTRRWERGAPNLVALLAAVAIGERVLDVALEREGGQAAVAGLEGPDSEGLFRAFCREQLELHSELRAAVEADASGETLELTVLGLKVAGLHEARRLRGLLEDGTSPGGQVVERPGRLLIWRAMWLQRPEDLSNGLFLPLMGHPLGGAATAWRDHLARWGTIAQGD